MVRILGLLGLLVSVLSLAPRALAAPGQLDVTFGNSGKQITSLGLAGDEANSVAIDDVGRIVVVGRSSNGVKFDFAIARYDSSGNLDPTFGDGGKVITPIGPGDNSAYAVAIDGSGRIVVAGELTGNSSSSAVLARYDTSGNLDLTFGSGGKVVTPVLSFSGLVVRAVVVDGSGRIVVAGSARNVDNDYDFALARYDSSGNLDPTFGSGGKVITPMGSSNDVAYGLAIDAAGRLVVAGEAHVVTGSIHLIALARYDASGSLDPTFGTGGKVTNHFTPTSSWDTAFSVAIDGNDRILIAGASADYTNANFVRPDIAVARYDSSGNLDPTFGNGGAITFGIGESSLDVAFSMALDDRERIVVAGQAQATYGFRMVLARIDGDGHLDPTFGSAGKVELEGDRFDATAQALAIDQAGRIVVAGKSYGRPFNNIAVARFRGGDLAGGQISGGGYTTCVINTSGGLECWGSYPGDGTNFSLTPVPVPGFESGVLSVSASANQHVCAVNESGQVKCWGVGYALGAGVGGEIGSSLTPIDVPGISGPVAEVAAGWAHTCARLVSGGVQCWGLNNKGQLGDGTLVGSIYPVAAQGLAGVVSISSSFDRTCAVTAVGGVACWGEDYGDSQGSNWPVVRPQPVAVTGFSGPAKAVSTAVRSACVVTAGGGAQCWGYFFQPTGALVASQTPVGLAGFTSGVKMVDRQCVVTQWGSARCWGAYSERDSTGSRADERATELGEYQVRVLDVSEGVASISGGGCALMDTGAVRCWGPRNGTGVGYGVAESSSSLWPVERFSEVAAGTVSTCARTTAGHLMCWGGYVGDYSEAARSVPVRVYGPSDELASQVKTIAAGDAFNCAVSATNDVLCWGWNAFGQLGNGSTVDRTAPDPVVGLSGQASSVSAGNGHACAVTTAGGVKCWGRNESGQLGNGTRTSSLVPVSVIGLSSGVAKVFAGNSSTCALTVAGGVKCWGWNRYGQLGDGTTVDRLSPVGVVGLASGVLTMSVGRSAQVCAVMAADGSVWCWGQNDWLAVLNQSYEVSTPSLVVPPPGGSGWSRIKQVAVGGSFACATGRDVNGDESAMWCWGFGAGSAQMNPVYPSTPSVVLHGTSDFVSLSAGSSHACVVTFDGRVACWGTTAYGKLGDGWPSHSYTGRPDVDLSVSTIPVLIAECGDGVRAPAEQCDDGNRYDFDCCSSNCTLNNGAACQVGSALVGQSGGSVSALGGAVSLAVPEGAVMDPLEVTLQDAGGGSFSLGDGVRSAVAVAMGPSGHVFDDYVTARLQWMDLNGDGFVDNVPALYEGTLSVFHNGVRIAGPCGDPVYRPGLCAAVCCDQDSNTWTFQTNSFSEFALASRDCSSLSKVQLKLSKLDRPGGNSLSFRGEATLNESDLAHFDPVRDGVRLVLANASGTLELSLGAGTYDASAKKGWKTSGSGSSWMYVDSSKSNPLAGVSSLGSLKVVIKRSAKVPGGLRLQVTGKKGSYDLQSPTSVSVLMGQGACARADLVSLSPGCLYNSSQTTLVCR